MSALQKVQDRINEYDQGYMVEYKSPGGSNRMLNKLDFEVAKKHQLAKEEEAALRVYNHTINITALVIVIVIVMLIMLVVYINMTTDITGIYYDANGNKIEIYHNKTLGSLEIKDRMDKKTGIVKKINSDTYGIYLNEDLIVKNLESLAQPIAAYANIKTGDIRWKNNVWKLDKECYMQL